MELYLQTSAKVCFFIFSIGIVLRDFIYFIFFSEKIEPVTYACINVGVLFFIPLIFSFVRPIKMVKRISSIGIYEYIIVVILGLLCAYIYTYFWILKELTPGLFNIIDYGATPILTGIFGIIIFKEYIGINVLLLYPIYIIGLSLLVSAEAVNVKLMLVSLTFPLATSVSDVLVKKLMSLNDFWISDRILFIRFAIAFPFLFFYSLGHITIIEWDYFLYGVIAAILFGYFPMKFLVIGIRIGKMSDLAMYEMLIPLLSFLGSIPYLWHTLTMEALVVCVFLLSFIGLNLLIRE
uniref:EamA-like transporter family protein n=1 Tax=Candidatus Kentrum sp. UNK TaxID=2126344 RepID=A0A451AZU7_9GAMM|nr:MAG: hypothetical protein BECKUNK1418G_GA0071005_10713 [Candidatus Kentron sp. UNK]VFK71564.1 MAG: hypothetical protein BECKUNK1418H_GA0071006_10723 [Candidatus Kentron sp. UNK]